MSSFGPNVVVKENLGRKSEMNAFSGKDIEIPD